MGVGSDHDRAVVLLLRHAAAAGLIVLQQVRRTGHPVTRSAEYKQVTVLFADVVHSMDIAKAVGPSGCARSWPGCSTGPPPW